MPALIAERQNSFQLGANDSAAPVAYRADEAELLQNVWIAPDASAEVRGGSQRTHSAALDGGSQSYGAIEFRLANGTVQLCRFVGDTFQTSTDGGVNWTSQATGLTEAYWSIVTMRRGSTNWLIAANGGANAKKWDGTTFSNVSNIQANPRILEVHNDRLWNWASGNTVQASQIADFEVYATPSGLTVPVQAHEDLSDITGLKSIGTLMLVFKRKSIAYINGFGTSDLIVATGARGISRDVGCIAFRSIVACGSDGVAWLSERGFEFMPPGGQPVNISSQLELTLRGIGWSNIINVPGIPTAIWYPRRRSYMCAFPTASTSNSQTFVYRLPDQGKPGAPTLMFQSAGASGSTELLDSDGYAQLQEDASGSLVRIVDGYEAIADAGESGLFEELDGDGYCGTLDNTQEHAALFTADVSGDTQQPFSDGYDGFLRRWDFGELDDVLSNGTGGQAIPATIVTRPFLFGQPHQKKKGRVIRVLAESSAASDLLIALLSDGSAGTEHTKALPIAAGQPRRVEARVVGRGFTHQARIRASKAGLRISAVEVFAEQLREVA